MRLCDSLAGMNSTSSSTPFHAPDTPAVLLEIARAVSSTLDLKELLKIVAQRTAAACGADVCSIFLWSPSGDQFVPVMSQTASGEQMDELWEKFKQMGSQKGEQILAIIATIEGREPIVLNDPVTSGLLPARWIETFRLKALLSVPLIRQDRVIGVLVLHQMVDGKPFTDAQTLLASAIASQVALAIENARLFQATQERLRQCETLLAVSRSLSSTLDLKETLRLMATEKGLRLQLTETADPLIVYADRDRVGQVLMNLLGNAIKFTPSGGEITVTARNIPGTGNQEAGGQSVGPQPLTPNTQHLGERVEIAVTDTGEGIPAEELPHIFDKFYQVQYRAQAKAKGTGLGLAIAKSLVELQGGRIWATSEIGRGSTFAFTLPQRPLVESCNATAPSNAENLS